MYVPARSWGSLVNRGVEKCNRAVYHAPESGATGIFEGGEILYKGEDILKMNEKELRKIRGTEIGFIFQDPMTSLNPTMKIGNRSRKFLLKIKK